MANMALSPKSANGARIPVFAVGQSRTNAETIAGLFDQTAYHIAGILDALLPPPYNFTGSNLALALRPLNPRPRAIIVGEAISSEDSAEAVKVWKQFVDDLAIENPLLVGVSDSRLGYKTTHKLTLLLLAFNCSMIEKGWSIEEIKLIPKDVLIKEIIGTLDRHFGSVYD